MVFVAKDWVRAVQPETQREVGKGSRKMAGRQEMLLGAQSEL